MTGGFKKATGQIKTCILALLNSFKGTKYDLVDICDWQQSIGFGVWGVILIPRFASKKLFCFSILCHESDQ